MHIIFKIPLFLISVLILLFSVWMAREEDIDAIVGPWAAEDRDIVIPRSIRFNRVTLKSSGEITLNVMEAGKESDKKPLVILLHGFPDTALLTWHGQVDKLVDEGYHVIAPDMRGYNTSDKPAAVSDYDLNPLTQDVRSLITEYAGRKSATVVGHDWGGVVASTLAVRHPELVDRLVLLDIPHANAMVDLMLKNPSQLLSSWYIFFFQLPSLPESKFMSGNYSGIMGSYASMARKGIFGRPVLERLRDACSKPHALTSMINYYRQMIRSSLVMKDAMVTPEERQKGITKKEDVRIRVPTLILFGREDKYVKWASGKLTYDEYIHPSVKGQSKFFAVDDADHWVMHDAPDIVNAEIFAFLAERKK